MFKCFNVNFNLLICTIIILPNVFTRSTTTTTTKTNQLLISNNQSKDNPNNDNNHQLVMDKNQLKKNIDSNGGGGGGGIDGGINTSDHLFTSYWNDLNLIYKLYQQCSKNDTAICLKLKLATALENMSKSMNDIKIFDGLSFIKDDTNNGDDRNGDAGDEHNKIPKASLNVLNENDILNQLPRSMADKDNALTTMIWNKILNFFQSHTLQIKFPSSITNDEGEKTRSGNDNDNDSDSAVGVGGESRDKKKKDKGAFIMIPLLLGGTFIPIAYGALALLAGKALIVSKLALVLASIIGIKKLISNSGGHHESSHEVVVSSGGGHSSSGGGWGRQFSNDLAYKAYLPNSDRTTNHI